MQFFLLVLHFPPVDVVFTNDQYTWLSSKLLLAVGPMKKPGEIKTKVMLRLKFGNVKNGTTFISSWLLTGLIVKDE